MTRSVANMDTPKFIGGIAEVADYYDGVILDLWGVVHDGVQPLPGTIGALEALRNAGKIIWLLSNAPRRSQLIVSHLEGMGISRRMYDGLLTSGEAAHALLRDHCLVNWGQRCYQIGRAPDDSLYQGLNIDMVDDIDRADFVLNSAFHPAGESPFEEELRAAAARRLPMLCPNPDKVVHVGHHLMCCPGTAAKRYEELGGAVVYRGKPHPEVYAQVLADMGLRRVLAVGDGMATDVAGAVGAGIDVALVMSGIHRVELATPGHIAAQQTAPDKNRLALLAKTHGFQPHYVINFFSW